MVREPCYTYCLRTILQFALLLFLSSHFSWGQIIASSRNPATASDRSVLRRFEERYRSATRLQVTFLELYTENERLIRTEAGTAYFLRPGKMRWEYESPEKNIFLVDGKTAWFYVPADHTVTRLPAKRSTDWRTPLALLAGEAKLSKVCARVGPAADMKPEDAQNAVFYCIPRGTQEKDTHSGPGTAEPGQDLLERIVFLEVSKATGELARVFVREGGNVELEFRFANWKFNPVMDDALFRFKVPAGVAIVNGELPTAQTGVNP